MLQISRLSLAFAGLFGSLAVALGAFGAHALRPRLSEALQAVWQTAVFYHALHAVALLALAALAEALPVPAATGLVVAVACFALGIVLFSGSLYWLALGGPRWLGPITPLGGLCLLLGWAALGAWALRCGQGTNG